MEKQRNGGRRTDPGRELLVLGLLRGNPLSAYHIDRAVRRHTTLYRGLGHGNVYNFVDTLARSGYLTGRSSRAKRGPAASKLVYHLTSKGEQRFHHLLDAVIYDPESCDAALEIALVLLGELPRDEATRTLMRRNKELVAQERRLKRLRGDSRSRSGPSTLANSHAVSRLQGEQRFLHEVLRLMQNPRWHPDWE